jgi:biotin-(acetyl-CoA carboxylase) ligase
MLGKNVFIEENGSRLERRAIDVAEDGSLVTELPDGSMEHVFAGDISLREETE